MLRTALVTLALALLWAASPASAVTILAPDGGSYGQWAARMHVPAPQRTITVRRSPCPYYLPSERSCATSTGTIYLASFHDDNPAVLRHELGHEYDFEHPDQRAAFRPLVDAPSGPWQPTPDTDAAPTERFANVYSECASGRATPKWWRVYPWKPTRSEYRAACAFIRRSGGWYMR